MTFFVYSNILQYIFPNFPNVELKRLSILFNSILFHSILFHPPWWTSLSPSLALAGGWSWTCWPERWSPSPSMGTSSCPSWGTHPVRLLHSVVNHASHTVFWHVVHGMWNVSDNKVQRSVPDNPRIHFNMQTLSGRAVVWEMIEKAKCLLEWLIYFANASGSRQFRVTACFCVRFQMAAF